MQFKTVTLVALSAVGAVASNEEKRQLVPTDPVGVSVISVLATAVPSSVASLAINDPNALSSQLASSLSAGKTPDWYQALPSDVKSYLPKLFPASTSAEPTPSNTNPVESAISSAISSIESSLASSVGSVVSASISAGLSGVHNSTTISTVHSATLTTTATGGSSSAGSSSTPASSSSTGGASYPTAVVGAGVAGALGFLGMLAL